MLLDYAKLGLKNLRHRQLRSWLTMIGIFIGIATVVSLIALGAGLKAAIAGQFSSLGTDKLIVSAKGGSFGPPGQGAAAQLTLKDVEVVQRTAYVRVATGRLIEPALAEFNNKKRLVFFGSIPSKPEERDLVLDVINLDPVSGRYPKNGDGLRVTLGADFSSSDRFGKPVRVGDNLLVNGKKIEVIGILPKKGSPQFDSAIFMMEDPMRDLLNVTTRYSAVAAQVTSPDEIDLAQAAIEKNLRSSRDVKERKEDFTVETPADVLDSFNTIIGGVTAVLVGIAAISLIVGGIGIMNTMYTAVLERTREIGVMKAVGARNSDVLALFLFESGMLGLAGGIIGVLLGAGFSKIVVIAGSVALGPGLLAAQISPSLVFSALAFSFLTGTIAGSVPAYEASKLPPVEALRQ